MSDQPVPPAVEQPTALQRLRERGIHSVFDVVREERGDFVARMGSDETSEAEARELYDLALQRASGLVRLHTELIARDEPASRTLPKLASGGSHERMEALSIGDGGDYESWFARAGLFPAPDSVASLFSPASYLVDLYRVAKKLHATTSEYHIDKRRPDLQGLPLTQARMDTELPTLELVNEILARGIEGSTTATDTADQLIAGAVFPFGLPYDVRADEISLGMRALGTDEVRVRQALGELDHGSFQIGADPAAQHRSTFSGEVVRACLDLSPGEYGMMVNTVADDPAATARHWGGSNPAVVAASDIIDRSRCSLADIHEVLATTRANIGNQENNNIAEPAAYGAKFLNSKRPSPSVTFDAAPDAPDPYGAFVNMTGQHPEYLHRLMRLKARVPLTYEEIDWIYAQSGDSGSALSATLRGIATYLRLHDRSGLTVDVFAALVGNINFYTKGRKSPFLEELFQRDFLLELGRNIDFGTAPDPAGNSATPTRLAQGLGIDLQTLRKLACLATKKELAEHVVISQSLDFWGALYRLVHIPRLAGLNVDEGLALWSCMESTPGAIVGKLCQAAGTDRFDSAQHILLRTLACTDWLREREIDIPTLMALVSTKHRTTATVDILQFIANLHASTNGDAGDFASIKASDDEFMQDQLARHVGAQFGLTAGVARAMIYWIDRVIATMDPELKDYSSEQFWKDIASPYKASAPTSLGEIGPRPVQYCHLLGQFALACHLTGLQEQDIALIVAPRDGTSRLCSSEIPPLTLETVFWLFNYTEWRDALTGSAAEARLHLGHSAVAPPASENPAYLLAHFAELNGWEAELATGVWTIIGHTPTDTLRDMRYVRQLSQWIAVAKQLELSPEKLGVMHTLVNMTDLSDSHGTREALSAAVLAAVRSHASASKSNELTEQLVERRRDALLRYYLHNVVPEALKPKIKTADDLYEYMLIDAQVSAKVTTSRVAEAISSVQLYLHRCREGLEPSVLGNALATEMRPGGYFAFWDAYNKRYGTWAGLQRLLRYPASYIDPTLRYTKTKSFRTLEDALSQGRLTGERAEDAFFAYLDALRTVFDIEYIDGFQMGTAMDSPILFLGRNNDSPVRYFWRQTGPATVEAPSAWTEWLPVEADIPPYSKPGEQPSIVYFSGAPRVVWWTWKTTGVTSSTVATTLPEIDALVLDNAALKEDLQLYVNIASLRNDHTWVTYEHAIARTDEDLSGTFVTVYEQYGEEHLLFVAPRKADPTLPGALRSFNRSLIAGPGPGGVFLFPWPRDGAVREVRRNALAGPRCPKYQTTDPEMTIEAFISSDGLFDIEVKAPLIAIKPVTLTLYFDDAEELTLAFGAIAAGGSRRLPVGRTWKGLWTAQWSIAGVFGADIPWTTVWWANASLQGIGTGVPGYQTLVPDTYYPDRDHRHWLSTRAAPVLQERIRHGVDSLLSYATQTMLVEPSNAPGFMTHPIRWIGGAASYMWELFFHAPFLIACRLLDEQRFDEAETWLRRIFSPSGYVDAEGNLDTDPNGNVRYWNVRPLQEDTAWGPVLSTGTDDPDAVAMSDPMHYKLAVYQRWMQLYMNRGDMAYRQQTRDTMTEAKMWYVQASQMLGRRPYFHGLLPGVWTDPTLSVAAATTNPALDALETLVGDASVALPPTQMGQVRIVDGVFLAPVDEGTLVWWDRFAQRLYNLRHGLSLDGQPLHLPLYETPVSPRDLQQRRLAADAGAGGFDAGAVTLPAFRFLVLHDRARAAVQQLMQFGSNLQGILERRDYDALNVLQQTQAVQIHELTGKAHALQIKVLEHTATGLQVARAQASERQRHYAGLVSQFMNAAEIASMGMRTAAPILLHGSVGATVTAAALDMVPNTWIAGMAAGVGGTTWSAVARAVAEGLTTEANVLEMTAGTLDMVAGFQRRREEWQLQSSQAAFEIAQLDTQIAANAAAYDQALKQATQMDIEHGYAQAVLDTLTTRFTGKDLFNWQAGRVSTLYYQLYDATLSLCSWAQKAYQFETDDGGTFFQPGAWDDRYQGLLAGESLALGLQRLERAYLTWDQRALEVERTLSLGALAGQSLGDLIAEALDTKAPAANQGKLTVGYEEDVLTLSFVLKDAGILDDYPSGMQLGTKRRIRSIAVTLPAVLGPYEDIRAVLGYAGGAAAQLPSGCTAVALSRGLADSGQFVLDFNDGKYLPFEGIPVDDTGTLSLRFPNGTSRKQEDMLRSITDVILHVRYTIRKDQSA